MACQSCSNGLMSGLWILMSSTFITRIASSVARALLLFRSGSAKNLSKRRVRNWSSRLPDGNRKDASFQFRRRRLASPAQSVKRCGRSDGAEASISGSRKLLRKFCDDFRVMRVAELVNRHDALKLVTTFDQDFRIACECRRVA